MRMPILFKLLALCILTTSGWADSAVRKTVWTGVYTAEQAKRGETAYAAQCSRCHRDDLSAYTGLKGSKFIENWREDSLNSLWVRISKTMPAGAPGALKEHDYLDILAYILRENEFPAGASELNAAVISEIRFEGKDGPAPVPDFSLVQVVGCLSKDPDGAWRLKQATDPLRTRDPNSSPTSATAPGKNTFRILDGSSLKPDTHDGRTAAVKGFLIRKPDDDRLNTTSVEVIGPVCR